MHLMQNIKHSVQRYAKNKLNVQYCANVLGGLEQMLQSKNGFQIEVLINN